MSIFENARFVRFATLLAVALALLVSGVVVGAAGGPLLMGAANSAGITNTSLTTSSTGNALVVTQSSTGTALRGVATNGIAGFFQSANGSGVSGVVANNTKYGVFGANDAAAFGGGAAIRASGQQNHGVVATTANAAADALRGINTGGGQALDLVVNAGVAPMSVNSNTKVANLNADKLDGLDSTAFGRSFGDGKLVNNINDIACGQEVVVGSLTTTVAAPSRIWVDGHGSVRHDASDATEYGLWLRLRDADDTVTLAVSTMAWDIPGAAGADAVLALSTGGPLMSAVVPESGGPAYEAPAGTYILQLVVFAAGVADCSGNLPDFGYNSGGGMAYLLLATE